MQYEIKLRQTTTNKKYTVTDAPRDPFTRTKPWLCMPTFLEYFDVPPEVTHIELIISDQHLGQDCYKVRAHDSCVTFLDVSAPHRSHFLAASFRRYLRDHRLHNRDLYVRVDY